MDALGDDYSEVTKKDLNRKGCQLIKIAQLFAITLLIILPNISNAEINEINADQALEITKQTEEVQTFLKYFGTCEGCNPSYSDGKAALIGCTEYKVEPGTLEDEWNVEFWVSDACSFRYGGGSTKIIIAVNKLNGEVSTKIPKLEYIKDAVYCEFDSDCLCRSGSGVPFLGCVNTLHGPVSWAGSYQCDKCKCINNSCAEENNEK